MKKFIVLTAFIAFGILSNSANAAITIFKHNKGTNGYNKVIEGHSGGSHSLDCYDPGNDACVWSIKPSLTTSVNVYDIDNIVTNVESLIANGNPTGSYDLDGEYSVSWTANPMGDYELTINQI